MNPRPDRRFLFKTALLFLLLLFVVAHAGRILTHPGGRESACLSARTEAFLSQLQAPLSATYFVSAREKMPSHLKGVEASVRGLLDALKARAPERIDVRIIDPETGGPSGIAYASRRKASPFTVRTVHRDEHSEQAVWSSLVLSYARHPDVLVQGITPADLPYLEDLIVQNLKALDRPVRPIIAVSAPPSFRRLSDHLEAYGRVVRIDLDRTPRIPPEADILFWVQPARMTPQHLGEFQRFVAAGRTAVLAGSAYTVHYEKGNAGDIRYRTRPLSPAWETLLSPLGLRPRPDLLMDKSSGPVPWQDADGTVHWIDAPFHLRCMPGFYTLKNFLAPARGALNFVAASPLQINPGRTTGFQVEILGTTTGDAWVSALPHTPFAGAALLPPRLKVGKQNLMVLLKPEDTWRGQVLVLASSSPFRDGIFNQPGYAHQVFLQTLMRTFTDPRRLVRGRIERPTPQAIPPLSALARFTWRVVVIFLVPFGLLALGIRRCVAGGGCRTALEGIGRTPVHIAAALAAIFLGTLVWKGGAGIGLDLTRDAANTPLPQARRLLSGRSGDLRAELVISPRASLPASMKSLEAAVRARLHNLGIPSRTLRPETLSGADRTSLNASGLRPFQVQTVRNDSVVSLQIWSGLRLYRGQEVAAIPRLDAHTLDHLDFLLAAAVRRIQTGRAPHVVAIAETPRLSPAEAYTDYYQKGLVPPKGADVYSEVKRLLRTYGYRVSCVNPQTPHLPEDTDVLLYLQPRRDASRAIRLLSRHLTAGRSAIVALQHFNIQQRQYPGTGFQTVYWPQPQFQDLDRYLRLFGVAQVREVLMDRTRSHLNLETQINRRAVREYEGQEVALPFLIRAVSANFTRESPITRHLGSQLFIWGNRFALDAPRLAELGLSARVLIATSDQAWSHLWKGGWLPGEIFEPRNHLPGPQPLSVLLHGRFPPVKLQERAGPETALALQTASPLQPEGTLLLIGCSEMFKNDHLYAPDFQHDQFLLNALANAAYGPEMAQLQARRATPPGFAFQTPQRKAFWRLTVAGAGPLLILLYGLQRYVRHRF